MILFGIFLLITNIIHYLIDPSSWHVLMDFIFLIVVVIGLFALRGNYTKNFYLTVTVVLAIMWIVGFIQPFSPDMNNVMYYMIAGVFTLIIIILFMSMFKANNKLQKALEPFDKILSVNPQNVTALNDKGVKLVSQLRYMEAMQCFDKVLEIDPGNSKALHNKNVMEKIRDHTVSDYFKKIPILEFNIGEKEGELILEAKKKEIS